MRFARYMAVMRWFAVDAIQAQGWRIAVSAVAELLGFACKVSALGGLLVFVHKLQLGGTFYALGRLWPVDTAAASLAAGASVAALFALGAFLSYLARAAAIDVVSECSRRWIGRALSVARDGSLHGAGTAAIRTASLAGQDALAAGRVVWQLVRGAASVVTGIWLAAGMLWLEPLLTALVSGMGLTVLIWQYRASIRGAKGTRELEHAATSMRQVWGREAGTVGRQGAGAARLPIEFERVILLRADQLRVIEQGGLSSAGVMAVLLGCAALYFGWEAPRMAGRWELVVAYAIALRSLVGILESNARRIVAIHRLYPNLSRYWRAVVMRVPDEGRAEPAAMAEKDDGDPQLDDLDS